MSRPNTSLWVYLSLAGISFCAILGQGCDQSMAEPFMSQEQSTGRPPIDVIPEGGSERFVNLGDRSFSFSTASTAVTIWASSSGGNAPPSEVPTYKVYGDGRVEKRYPGREPETVAQLGTEGITELLELAVAGGLMEWDRDNIQTRVFNAIDGRYSNPDASTQEIKIFLTFYRDLEGTESSPISRVIVSPDTRIRSQLAPEIQELQAVWGIFRALLEAGR